MIGNELESLFARQAVLMVQLYLFYINDRDGLIFQSNRNFTRNLSWDFSMHEVILEKQVFRRILFDNEFEFALELLVITINYLPKEKQS